MSSPCRDRDSRNSSSSSSSVSSVHARSGNVSDVNKGKHHKQDQGSSSHSQHGAPPRKKRRSDCDSSAQSVSNRSLLAETVTNNVNKEQAFFIVGSSKEVFLEQKCLFAAKSDVFYAMLYGRMQETGPIVMPDVEPDAFRLLLSFLGDETVKFTSMEQAVALCNVAEKYNLTAMKQKCAEYLYPMTVDDVWHSLDCGCLYNIPMLKDAAMDIVREKTSHVLLSRQIVLLSRESLRLIVQQDHLDVISETEVLTAIVNWGKHNCRLADRRVNRENIREALGDVLNHIRFLTMSVRDIVKYGPVLLTPEEICKLVKVIQEQENRNTIRPFSVSVNKRHKFDRGIPLKSPVHHVKFSTVQAAQHKPFEFSSGKMKSITMDFAFVESVAIVGVTIPTRLNKENDHNRFYFEDITVNIKDVFKETVSTGSFKGRVEYNVELNIPLRSKRNDSSSSRSCLSCDSFHSQHSSNNPRYVRQRSLSPPASPSDSPTYSPTSPTYTPDSPTTDSPASPAYRPFSPTFTFSRSPDYRRRFLRNNPFTYTYAPSVCVEVIFNNKDSGYYPWKRCSYIPNQLLSCVTKNGFITGFSYILSN